MWECQVSVDVQAPVEQVFRRLEDFTRHSDFSDGLRRVEQTTAGPVGVGTQFRAEETVPGKYVSFCEITALQEPHLIAWKAWVEGVMRTQWEFRLSGSAAATHLVQVSRWEPAGPLGMLMLNLHRKRHVPRENQRSLDRIKSVLETEAAAAGQSSLRELQGGMR
jgi:Polyketide cyclase / dehydrase and lipid transport